MIFDLILLAIFLLSVIFGYRKGLIYTLIHTAGWLFAVLGAYLLTPVTAEFLDEKTDLYDNLLEMLLRKLDLTEVDITRISLPESLRHGLLSKGTGVMDGVAAGLATLLFYLIIFLTLFLIIKIALWLILRLLSKKYNDGLAGTADGLAGAVFGMVRGVILILLFLAVVIPLADLFSPDLAKAAEQAMEGSYLARPVYDNNPLLFFLQDLMGL